MPDLKGVVALVTGASKCVGRGVAEGLIEAGATVHVTGRSLEPGGDGNLLRHSVHHANDVETEAAVDDVIAADGRLDILVNNAWPGYERMVEGDRFTWVDPLWDQPMGAGTR